MTVSDLQCAGIIEKNDLSNLETAILFLNYNEKVFNEEKFLALKKEVYKKFSNLENLKKEQEMEFLQYSVAIINEKFQNIFKGKKNNLERVLSAHSFVVKTMDISQKEQGVKNTDSESIKKARTLAEVCDSFKIRGKKYTEQKKHYNYVKECVNDEAVFSSFYNKFEGKMDEDSAKKLISSNLLKIEKEFLERQNKYLKFFVKYQVEEDLRLLKDQKVM